MTLHVKVGGVWKESVDGPSVNVGGTWRNIDFGYVRDGGVWKEMYVRDNTGPASPTSATATWSNGNCVVSWTNPSDADYNRVEIHRVRDPAAGSAAYLDGLVTTQYGTAGAAMTWTDTNIVNDYMVYAYYLYPVDNRGNYGNPTAVQSMSWTGTARGRVPSPITFLPTDSGTYRAGAWRTDATVTDQFGNPSRVIQGYTASGMNYAHYFYNNQIYDTLYGTGVSAMSIGLNRVNAGGNGGAVFPYIWGSSKATKTGDGSTGLLGGTLYGTGLCRNGTCDSLRYYDLPSNFFAHYVDVSPPGSFRMRGVAFYSPDTVIQSYSTSASYMILFSAYESAFGFTPGAITVTHTG